MLAALLALQVSAVTPERHAYASPALRDLVMSASRANRAPPPALRGYHATAESELAMLLRRPDASEVVAQLEQTRSAIHWSRDGAFEQNVNGYRSQSIGLNVSAMSYFRQSWIVPTLYGDRLSILFGSVLPSDSARAAREAKRKKPKPAVIAVHPLGRDRDAHYAFTGGDTVITLRVLGRDVPIVRVLVEPGPDAGRNTPAGVVLFRGEVDLDATRLHVVRMRGQLVRVGGEAPPRAMGVVPVIAVAFIELENAEVLERYWLPSYQRVELQAASPTAGEGRSVIRIISRVRNLVPREDAQLVATAVADDTLRARPHYLRVASRDSLAGFSAWARPLGEETSVTHSDDFQEIGPDRWRASGKPRFDFQVERFTDFFHFSPIEGAYTGYGVVVRMRDLAPGLTFRANGGWAWAEQTARGRLSAELARGPTETALRAGRGLDVTNDFRATMDSGPMFEDLLGSRDNRDYVDRLFVMGSVARRFGPRRAARLRFETGLSSDRAASRHVTRGFVKIDSGFRDNRGITPGRYIRNAAVLELNPDVNGEMLNRGAGASLILERGSGELSWTRAESRISLRTTVRTVTVGARLDAGAVFGPNVPPQQLYELGGDVILPAYGYKMFAGDRAAALRVVAMRAIPILGSPIHLRGQWYLPALAPTLYSSVRVARVDAVEPGTAASMLLLGPPVQESDGWRSSAELGLRFFGGALGIGMTRAVDHSAPWRLRISFAQEL